MVPIEKNKEYELVIESVTNDGYGVGHIDGFCVFVKNGVTYDRVTALILKVKSGYAYAKITKLIQKSPYRCQPICNVHSKCGGCQLMHIDYDYQLQIKKKIILDSLNRIGGLNTDDCEMIASDEQIRYRNKMIFPFAKEKNRIVCGFYEEKSHNVVPLSDCFLGDEVNGEIINTVLKFAEKYNISVYDETTNRGILRRLFLRKGYHTKEIMVVLSVNAQKIIREEEFVSEILKISDNIKSIILNVNTKKNNSVLGNKNILLYGKETICDYLCGLKYEISPYSFFQINPVQTEKLYQKAIDFANITKNDLVMDIYCGIGTISLAAAKTARSVVGIEIVEQAIADARKNASNNGIENVRFYADDASVIVPELVDDGEKFNVVILDPPRKGSDEKTLSAIVNAQPERIVYISCNPSTLARDLKFLKEKSYEIKNVCGVDMFPNTTHIEVISLLSRVQRTK